MRTELKVALVAAVMWLVAVVAIVLVHDGAGSSWLTEVAWVGDMLAPLGAIATVVAIVHAFELHRRSEREASVADERRRQDRLAEAYARWLPRAADMVGSLRQQATDWNIRVRHPAYQLVAYAEAPGLREVTKNPPPDYRLKLIETIRDLKNSKIEVLLFERDPDFRSAVTKLCDRMIHVPRVGASKTSLYEVGLLVTSTVELKSDLDSLISRVASRLGALSSERIEPAGADSAEEDDEESAPTASAPPAG